MDRAKEEAHAVAENTAVDPEFELSETGSVPLAAEKNLRLTNRFPKRIFAIVAAKNGVL